MPARVGHDVPTFGGGLDEPAPAPAETAPVVAEGGEPPSKDDNNDDWFDLDDWQGTVLKVAGVGAATAAGYPASACLNLKRA